RPLPSRVGQRPITGIPRAASLQRRVENVLKVEALTKTFGGLTAVRSVDAHFEAGKISAIIGPNGAGKTTFFNLISGAIPPTSGRILLKRSEEHTSELQSQSNL